MKKYILGLCLTALLVGCGTQSTEPVNETSSQYTYTIENNSPFTNDDLIYFIMIDRFYDGDQSNNNHPDFSNNPDDLKSYLGGDLQGIIDQLDYIQSVGATAIWLTPVAKNEPYGYHGYWTADFEAVDPHFGDMETLQSLVEKAHEKDIKVILDYVVNHTGYQHDWLNDPEKKDWFHNNGDITNYNDKNQVLNYNLAGLPDLNTENNEVKDYFFNNVLWWIKETGVDGLRLDTVKHVPEEFWNEFAYIIKQEYPNFYLLGEVFHSSPSYLASFNEVGFDSVTNFSMYDGIKETFKLYGDANKLKIAINNDKKFDDFTTNGIFLDNHDVSRLISRTSEHGEAYLKQGITFILTYPSIPIIYYGTEIGLEGGHDPDNRRLMSFESNEIYEYYQKILTLRQEMKDYDDVEILAVDKDYIVLAYANGSDSIITAFNISTYDKEISLKGQYIDYLTNESISDTLILKGLETKILLEE